MIQYTLAIIITLGIFTAYYVEIEYRKKITPIVVLLIAVLFLVYVIKSEFDTPKRVPVGERFFYIEMDGTAQARTSIEKNNEETYLYWVSGNYFNTQKEAEEYAKHINKLLIERTL